jgi:NADP-dependent 3-hydroxy acid dehydrogenase YdfG
VPCKREGMRNLELSAPRQVLSSAATETVVVPGAAAGVGRAVVRFPTDGARIGLIARGLDRLAAAQREVEEAAGRAPVLPVDAAD